MMKQMLFLRNESYQLDLSCDFWDSSFHQRLAHVMMCLSLILRGKESHVTHGLLGIWFYKKKCLNVLKLPTDMYQFSLRKWFLPEFGAYSKNS